MQNQAPDLSQLKDIYLPDTITELPIAFGWWILLSAILFTIIAGFYLWRKAHKRNATKRAAIELLNHQYEQFKDNNNAQFFLQQSNQILKRYCLDKYPEAVSLSGTAWTNFLIRHSHKTFLNTELANAISQGIYQKQCQFSPQELYQAFSIWLKTNKPIKTRNSLITDDAINTGVSND